MADINNVERGKLFIVSGPSGSGKTTLVESVLARDPYKGMLQRVVTYTTREPRNNEEGGEDYHFISKEEFQEKIAEDFFIEWTQWGDHYYGMGKDIFEKLDHGNHYVAILDREGAQKVVQYYPKAITIWIQVPDIEVLRKRLQKRGSDSEEKIEKRLRIAQKEMEFESQNSIYQHSVENDDLELSLSIFQAVLNQHLVPEKQLEKKK